MPPLKPGWYCFTAMNATDEAATDRQGPFESFRALWEWLDRYNIEYRFAAPVLKSGPPYFNEMTGDESGGMWAAGVMQVT